MTSTVSDDNKCLYFLKGKCFNNCEVSLSVGEEKTQFYVCIDQMVKLGEYFRVMFGDFKENNRRQFEIDDETPENMICFFKAVDPNPNVQKIDGTYCINQYLFIAIKTT